MRSNQDIIMNKSTPPRIHPGNWICCLFAALFLFGLAPGKALATDLTGVNEFPQLTLDPNGNLIGNDWCWAACTEMILNYYNYTPTIFDVVTYGVGNSTYDTANNISKTGMETRKVPIWVLDSSTGKYKLESKSVTVTWNGIKEILSHFSTVAPSTTPTITAQAYYGSLANPAPGQITTAQITTQIETYKAPFIIAVRWSLPPVTAGGPVQDLGGHDIVCYGYDSGVESIHDPFFGTYLVSDALLRSGPAGTIPPAGATPPTLPAGVTPTTTPQPQNTWYKTLTVNSSSLDLLIIMDTTGSMGPFITDVQNNLATLISTIAADFPDFRIAVANYKDEPPPDGPGDFGDYVYQANLPFTSGSGAAAAAIAAINGFSPGGGGDLPEAVYSALNNGLSGNGLSDANNVAWRPNPVFRMIIDIGDAPGHDPETWAGGHSYSDTIALATSGSMPIHICTINPGGPTDATFASCTAQFQLTANATGGVFVNYTDFDNGAGLSAIINLVSQNPNFPQGTDGSAYTTFSFSPVGQPDMLAGAAKIYVDLEKQNPRTMMWHRLELLTSDDVDSTSILSKLALPPGMYRWRTGFRRPASKLYLPSTGKTVSIAASTSFEPTYTTFQRVANPPNPVNPLTLMPATGGTPSGVSVTYSFGAVPGATKYAMQIFVQKPGRAQKLWRSFMLKPPANDPTASVLSKTVTGHNLSDTYWWQVQSLNYDRPKPIVGSNADGDPYWTSSQ